MNFFPVRRKKAIPPETMDLFNLLTLVGHTKDIPNQLVCSYSELFNTASCVAGIVSLCLTCFVEELHVYPQEIDEQHQDDNSSKAGHQVRIRMW